MAEMNALQGIDWELLREQKSTLFTLLNMPPASILDDDYPINIGEFEEHLSGIINLLDAIQDEAVDSGAFTEVEVFGSLEDRYD